MGIGDSFASGQGNPDVPAVPAPDEKAVCKATSLALLARKVEDAITALVQEIEQTAEQIAGHLPYVGKAVVGLLQDAENLVDFIDRRVSMLKGLVVGAVRDVEASSVFRGRWLSLSSARCKSARV